MLVVGKWSGSTICNGISHNTHDVRNEFRDGENYVHRTEAELHCAENTVKHNGCLAVS